MLIFPEKVHVASSKEYKLHYCFKEKLVRIIISFVKQKRNGKSFAPKHLIDSAVSNIICSLVLGFRYNYDEEEFKTLQQNIDTVMEYFIKLIVVSVKFCTIVFKI